MEDWIIDGTINATRIAEAAHWHLATTIHGLESSGLSRGDAEAFASFVFAARGTGFRGCVKPGDCVTDEQWDRLNLKYEQRLFLERG